MSGRSRVAWLQEWSVGRRGRKITIIKEERKGFFDLISLLFLSRKTSVLITYCLLSFSPRCDVKPNSKGLAGMGSELPNCSKKVIFFFESTQKFVAFLLFEIKNREQINNSFW